LTFSDGADERGGGSRSSAAPLPAVDLAAKMRRHSLVSTINFAKDRAREGDYERCAASLRRALECTIALQSQTELPL